MGGLGRLGGDGGLAGWGGWPEGRRGGRVAEAKGGLEGDQGEVCLTLIVEPSQQRYGWSGFPMVVIPIGDPLLW